MTRFSSQMTAVLLENYLNHGITKLGSPRFNYVALRFTKLDCCILVKASHAHANVMCLWRCRRTVYMYAVVGLQRCLHIKTLNPLSLVFAKSTRLNLCIQVSDHNRHKHIYETLPDMLVLRTGRASSMACKVRSWES